MFELLDALWERLCGMCCSRRNSQKLRVNYYKNNSIQEAPTLFRSNDVAFFLRQQHTKICFTLLKTPEHDHGGLKSALSWPFASWVPPSPCCSSW